MFLRCKNSRNEHILDKNRVYTKQACWDCGCPIQRLSSIIYFQNNKYTYLPYKFQEKTRNGEPDKRKSLTGMILQRIRLTANTPRGRDLPRSEQAAVNQILPGRGWRCTWRTQGTNHLFWVQLYNNMRTISAVSQEQLTTCSYVIN